jgi:hypothetical protein
MKTPRAALTLKTKMARGLAGATTAAVAVGLAGAVTAGPAAAQSGTVLRGVASNRCIEVPGSTTTDGTQLRLRDCDGADNQLWEWNADKQLVVYGDKCMDIGGDASVGSPVVIKACTGSADQKWELNQDLSVRSVGHPDVCADAWNAGTANGTAIAVWWCNG